jgi:hypothetical protein
MGSGEGNIKGLPLLLPAVAGRGRKLRLRPQAVIFNVEMRFTEEALAPRRRLKPAVPKMPVIRKRIKIF